MFALSSFVTSFAFSNLLLLLILELRPFELLYIWLSLPHLVSSLTHLNEARVAHIPRLQPILFLFLSVVFVATDPRSE